MFTGIPFVRTLVVRGILNLEALPPVESIEGISVATPRSRPLVSRDCTRHSTRLVEDSGSVSSPKRGGFWVTARVRQVKVAGDRLCWQVTEFTQAQNGEMVRS